MLLKGKIEEKGVNHTTIIKWLVISHIYYNIGFSHLLWTYWLAIQLPLNTLDPQNRFNFYQLIRQHA